MMTSEETDQVQVAAEVPDNNEKLGGDVVALSVEGDDNAGQEAIKSGNASRFGRRTKVIIGAVVGAVVVTAIAVGVYLGTQEPGCDNGFNQRGRPIALKAGNKLDVKKFDTCTELSRAMVSGRRCDFNGRTFGVTRNGGVMFDDVALESAPAADGGSDSTPSSDPTGQPGDSSGSEYSGTLPDGANFTSTNNQVSGVDEADIIKTDGKHFYSIVNPWVFASFGFVQPDIAFGYGFGARYAEHNAFPLVITSSWPPNALNVVSVTWLNGTDFNRANVSSASFSPKELFLEGDRVMVIGESYISTYFEENSKTSSRSVSSDAGTQDSQSAPNWGYYNSFHNFVSMTVVDISSPDAPQVVRKVEVEGYYVSARKVNSRATVVVENWPNMYGPTDQWLQSSVAEVDILPLFRDTANTATSSSSSPTRDLGGLTFTTSSQSCGDVQYTDALSVGSFTTLAVLSLAEEDDLGPIETLTIAGRGSVYASTTHLFLVQPNYQAGDGETTVVTMFKVDQEADIANSKAGDPNSVLSVEGVLGAPGTILNQFSVDHSGDRFRMATTTQGQWEWRPESNEVVQLRESSNHVFTFDLTKLKPISDGEMLLPVGKLVGLAPTERIYSTRFIGDRLFMVTFRQVDPLFVVDLSDNTKPKLLGELKLPGYSSYLHPLNDTYLIGFGREADLDGRDLGLKVALFDVSNVTAPEVAQTIVIGDAWSAWSEAEYEHKAFMYQPVTNAPPYDGVLAFPLSVYDSNKNTQTLRVYGLTSRGFEQIGDASHEKDEDGVAIPGVNSIFGSNNYGKDEAIRPKRSVLFEVPREGAVSNDLIVYSLSGIGMAAHSINTEKLSLEFESLALSNIWDEL